MAWLLFFADEDDRPLLLDRLNEDPEIAFIVSDGLVHPEASDTRRSSTAGYRRRWKAVDRVDDLADGHHSLWHVPAGPLPLVAEASSRGATLTSWRNQPPIPDPWSGWIEERSSAGFSEPLFGVSAPSRIRLTLWTRVSPYTNAEKASLPMCVSYWTMGHDMIVASDFQFGGPLSPAGPLTLRWWSRMKTVRLQPPGRRPPSSWAFPSALRRLKAGTKYSANNFNLDASIRETTPRRGAL